MSENLDIIQPKSDEHIYAQTAAYAHEQPYPHSRELSRDIGGAATAFLEGESVVTAREDFSGNKTEVEHTPDDYVSFLRNMDQETRSDVGFLAQKMQSYDTYRSKVDEALNEASEDDEHYLGRGSNGKAFMFEQDGKKYAVKTGGVTFSDARAFNRAKDIEGVSHLEGIDLDTNRSVMNLVPGKEAPRLTFEEREAIPQEHIEGVIDKAIELYNAGIQIDPKPSNFLYDTEKGFGIIDYQAHHNPEWSLSDQAMSVTAMLNHYPYNSNEPQYGTPGYEAFAHERAVRSVTMLNKFLDAMEQNHPDLLKKAAQKQAEVNANPRKSGGALYPVYTMPTDTQQLAAFKDRVIGLGLQGEEPKPIEYHEFDDLDVIDTTVRRV